ncbi:penicillin-binding protein 2 [Bacillus sp. CECT 9360]|uniref:peptidoglycan D,D-transpeptidase FtsI family protein n=1 Tax=Bacillus sp. CECT 9360 TaxID=2845821 RepID=UPI001E5B32E6|nr:penicillin-binding protein 2 [Bacillus sp. CECT 9360]CAH0343932.1 Penicillin-binding protein H [Bacillus sp. CECT 9360]
MEEEQKAKKKKRAASARLKFIPAFVFVLFTVLIFRLAYVQLYEGEMYEQKVNATNVKEVRYPLPRGKIFDRNNQVIVDNEASNIIVYIKREDETDQDLLEVAKKLSTYISIKTDKITKRDMKDYWIETRPNKALKKLTDQELQSQELTDKERYQMQLDRIGESDLKEIKNNEKKVLAIFREMKKGYAFNPKPIKDEHVTNQEVARVSEALDEMPGVDIITDWERTYRYGELFRSVLGSTTSREEGIPKEKLDNYLSKDYSRNDRVGKSQLEFQYEDVLRGMKSVTEIETNRKGDIVKTHKVSAGESGKNLMLTIDIDLQKKVEEILTAELIDARRNGGGAFLDKAFVVMMNPVTGEVLAMAGKQIEAINGKWEAVDYALGSVNSSFEMGSSVKGATVLSGYESGAIQPGQSFLDEPIYLLGTPVKKSVWTMGMVTDQTALKQSSNVYMFKTAMSMLGKTYHRNMKLPLDSKAFETFRYYFQQFGLGVKTGIDLPNEANGYRGQGESPGFLLDFTIGQYDTYTPMQLTQYISTLANGGYRVQPHLLKEIREPEMEGQDPVVFRSVPPVYLNRIDMDKHEVERVQEGFRKVFHEQGGTAASYFNKPPYKSYKIAGKTGTAESFYYDPELRKTYTDKPTNNLTLVGYAPYDYPEVAFSVVVPNARTNSHPISQKIGQGIMKAYFEDKDQHE